MTTSLFKNFDVPDIVLKKNQIDIWIFSLEKNLPQVHKFLNKEELTRANRLYFARHQRRFRNARGLSRWILSLYLDCDPASLDFYYNPHGKPEISQLQELQFNISHTKDWAVIAVGKKYPLGVDIEAYSARPYQGIAQHIFSEKEQMALESIAPFLKPWLFFHIWAQKEAFIKACGLGIFYPTQDFTALHTKEIWDSKNNTLWSMKPFMPLVGISAALCHHPQVDSFRYLKLDNPWEIIQNI